MAVEHARARALPKPWGAVDLRPWSSAYQDGSPIGEIWYERDSGPAIDPSLLLKLLFTNRPLSIQVHPDDAFAHSIGLASGKTEAWYVLSAAPEAKVGLGLKQRLTPRQLREAIDTGSISDLVRWHVVVADDVILVPARTIHAIGAGVVIAEIQQRSDATFRLFDYGSQRELHIDRAVAAADAGPSDFLVTPSRFSESRTVLISNAHFVLEKVDLAANSTWSLDAERETWLLVLEGAARVGSIDVAIGDAIFVQADRADIQSGPSGMTGLAAYTGGGLLPHLLHRLDQPAATSSERQAAPGPLHTQSNAAPTNEGLKTVQ
jgi:mannose-6-phosphate isomerase